MTESAVSQRFTPECATMFLKIMQRLAEVRLESEKVDIQGYLHAIIQTIRKK